MIFDIANNKQDIRDLLIFGIWAKIKSHKENRLYGSCMFHHKTFYHSAALVLNNISLSHPLSGDLADNLVATSLCRYY